MMITLKWLFVRQVPADHRWRRLHQVQWAVTARHPQGPRENVSRRSTSSSRSLSPSLPASVHKERPSRHERGHRQVRGVISLQKDLFWLWKSGANCFIVLFRLCSISVYLFFFVEMDFVFEGVSNFFKPLTPVTLIFSKHVKISLANMLKYLDSVANTSSPVTRLHGR